jgi:hypothetical protein
MPLAEPSYPPITEIDFRKATPPRRFEVKVFLRSHLLRNRAHEKLAGGLIK